MPRIEREEKDYGTAEIADRFKVVPKFTKGGTHLRVMDETAIDRLLLEDRITSAEHSILENLMGKLVKANFVGIKSPAYDAPLSIDPSAVGDRRANQIRSAVKLFANLDKAIGRDRRMALVNLVLMDVDWPADDQSLRDIIKVLADIL